MAEPRTCWVCYGTDHDTRGEWVAPCRCTGSAKYVHQSCLKRWIAEGHGSDVTRCPQCNASYNIQENVGVIVSIGNRIESFVNRAAPFLAISFATGFVWAGLGMYGAAVFVHVCGRDGTILLQRSSPLKLFITLPIIPISLVLFRTRVSMQSRHSGRLLETEPAIQELDAQGDEGWEHADTDTEGEWTDDDDADDDTDDVDNASIGSEEPRDRRRVDLTVNGLDSAMSAARTVAGGLCLPYIAVAVGRLLTPRTVHPLDRAMIGGSIYLIAKSLWKAIYQRERATLLAERRILDNPLHAGGERRAPGNPVAGGGR